MIEVPKPVLNELSGHSEEYCRALERGEVIFFDHAPIEIPADDLEFLLSVRQRNTRVHKNISYRPQNRHLRGSSSSPPDVKQRLLEIMERFSTASVEFLGNFLSPYKGEWHIDYASFRPLEEKGRELPLHKRNELLHVDAFPSRPTNGGRILRFFVNINPETARIWQVGGGFAELSSAYAGSAGLSELSARAQTMFGRFSSRTRHLLNRAGLPVTDRSTYDRFMLRFHDHLKENDEYQSNTERTTLEFPPGSSWIVFTDCVPHAVLSGRFALEQTFIIPYGSLVAREDSPLEILERQCGTRLVVR